MEFICRFDRLQLNLHNTQYIINGNFLNTYANKSILVYYILNSIQLWSPCIILLFGNSLWIYPYSYVGKFNSLFLSLPGELMNIGCCGIAATLVCCWLRVILALQICNILCLVVYIVLYWNNVRQDFLLNFLLHLIKHFLHVLIASFVMFLIWASVSWPSASSLLSTSCFSLSIWSRRYLVTLLNLSFIITIRWDYFLNFKGYGSYLDWSPPS